MIPSTKILKQNKNCNRTISNFYQTRQFFSSSVLIRIYKQLIQPIYQNDVEKYGVANEIALKSLQVQQNFLIRIAFRLKKTQKSRTIRKTQEICSINELHVYELLNLLS